MGALFRRGDSIGLYLLLAAPDQNAAANRHTKPFTLDTEQVPPAFEHHQSISRRSNSGPHYGAPRGVMIPVLTGRARSFGIHKLFRRLLGSV